MSHSVALSWGKAIVNALALMIHPMYLIILRSVPSVASLRRERTSVRQMGSCWYSGRNRRCRASERAAVALSVVAGRSKAMVMPSLR
eukprot:3556786-Ditylum_brightwellii.AAC.1